MELSQSRAAVGGEISRECIFIVQSAAPKSFRFQPMGRMGGSTEFEWGVYLSAPFSSEQRFPQQLRGEDAANMELSLRRGGEDAKRRKPNYVVFFLRTGTDYLSGNAGNYCTCMEMCFILTVQTERMRELSGKRDRGGETLAVRPVLAASAPLLAG